MRYLLIILILPLMLSAQEFQFRQEFDTIPVEINGWRPFAPWMGGDLETAPEFCDIDADGDFDCFVGNWGYKITYYENVSEGDSIQFSFITKCFAGIVLDSIYSGRLDPAFVDIDDDGDFDLFSSCAKGLVHFWENQGTPQVAEFIHITDSLEYIDELGRAHIDFTDIDNDGDYDMFIGDNIGRLNYYENVGTPDTFDFEGVTSYFDSIDVGDKAAPCFVDIDADGDDDLFIGEEYGKIWYYRNDSDSTTLNFTYITNYYDSIDVSDYASPDFIDIDGDNDFDLFIGRDVLLSNVPSPGDIFYYENIGTSQSASWSLVTRNYFAIQLGWASGNHGTDIDADSDYDMFLNSRLWDLISYYKNIGTVDSAFFRWITDSYQDISVNGILFFTDIDSDNDPDLFMGEAVIPNPPYPGLHLFENIGTPQNAVFNLVSENLVPWNYNVGIRPALADIDADGDKDLFLTDNEPTFFFFENIGNPSSPVFANPVLNWQGITPETGSPMCFYDIDQDGDSDLFLIPHCWYDILWFYRNNGTPEIPDFELETQHFLGEGVEIGPDGIDIVDIDDDGDGDFLFSTQNGGMMFFRNITGDTVKVNNPNSTLTPTFSLHPCYPNPFNSTTTLQIELPQRSKVEIELYNIRGQFIRNIYSGLQNAGSPKFRFDASDLASGVYFYKFRAESLKNAKKFSEVNKLILLK